MKTEVELNRTLLDEYKHFQDTRDKSFTERSKLDALREADKRKLGHARRYPELADDNYIRSMQEALPAVELTPQQKQRALEQQSILAQTSSNLNVERDHQTVY